MRAIITGGTGLIGRALAASLLRDDHEVIVLSRRPERATGLPTGMRDEARIASIPPISRIAEPCWMNIPISIVT
jgi:uncharacterized protein YbjT (DUF2867 family)